MERNLIAWNIPNMITIPLMAFIGWLLFGLIWQVAQNTLRGSAPANNEGGY